MFYNLSSNMELLLVNLNKEDGEYIGERKKKSKRKWMKVKSTLWDLLLGFGCLIYAGGESIACFHGWELFIFTALSSNLQAQQWMTSDPNFHHEHFSLASFCNFRLSSPSYMMSFSFIGYNYWIMPVINPHSCISQEKWFCEVKIPHQNSEPTGPGCSHIHSSST